MSQNYTLSDTVIWNDVIVMINDDNFTESDEAFSLSVSGLTSGVVISPGAATATIVIVSNDCKKVKWFGTRGCA